MIWQLICILGLASTAGAVRMIGNNTTVAVSGSTLQVLLNTTDGAEATTSPFNTVTPVEASHRNAILTRKRRNALIPELPATSLLNLSQYNPAVFDQKADGSVQLYFDSGANCTLSKNRLGSGSSGTVYACVFLNGSEVAAKFIQGWEDEQEDEFDLQNRVHNGFVVEAKEAFVLANSAKLHTTDLGGIKIGDEIPQHSLCIVMEKLDKELKQVAHKFKGKLESTKRIWRQVLEGVAAVHEKDIIWRGLNLQNILCTSSNPSEMNVKITDFRLATKGVGEEHHAFAGTPEYLAPEACSAITGKRIITYDGRVDAWALGVLLYELYFGKTPFEDPDDRTRYKSSMYINIESKEVEFFHDNEIPEAPFQMKDLIRKCLAKYPENRFRVHDHDPGDMPLISSHPWLTGDKKHEQERLTAWLSSNRFDNVSHRREGGSKGHSYSMDVKCPLHAAVKQMDVEMVEILLMQGKTKGDKAKLMDCKDDKGKTPRELAQYYKSKALAEKVMVFDEIIGIFDWDL